jgi:hypothetical protein
MNTDTGPGGTVGMVVVDCPWCGELAEVDADALRCQACGIDEAIVDEELPERVALAA